jgi:uncharacterized RDD family membrane protein YckC
MEEVAELIERLRPRSVDLAPIFPRAAALVVDLIVFTVLMGALMFGFGLLGLADHALVPILVSAVILAASQFGMEAMHGTSVGKWLFNLKVTNADGTPPTKTALAMRMLCRFPIVLEVLGPPLEPLGIAAIFYLSLFGVQFVALLSGLACYFVFRGKTLSDALTHTRVVYSHPPEGKELIDTTVSAIGIPAAPDPERDAAA